MKSDQLVHIPIESDTPLMRQYNSFKAKYPDALLLFRVGDFYETFGRDAVLTAVALGITLTKRSNGKASEIELAGFPYHALETYMPKLVRAGYKVAVCDQIEDPKVAKGIVKRAVTEMVTPGIATSDNILEVNSNNFLCSLYRDRDSYGAAFLDISTGEFLIVEGAYSYIEKSLQSLSPAEIIYPRSQQKEWIELLGDKQYATRLDDWVYTREHSMELLLKLFGTNSLKGFGIEDEYTALLAAGAAIQYLKDTEHHLLAHITRIQRIAEASFVWMDRFTIRNLELIHTPYPDGQTLLDVIDRTSCPMGARLLRRWIVMPLVDIQTIRERQMAVGYFTEQSHTADELRKLLKQMGDLERLIAKVAIEKVTPREVVQLKRGLRCMSPARELLTATQQDNLLTLAEGLHALPDLTDRISHILSDEAGAMINKGGYINAGVDATLDELRHIKHSGKEYIAGIQEKETQRTGISSLKIGFNNVFGYYLEVTNTHKHKVPTEWIRKQTLSNAERYITEELKEYEQKVLGAEEKILAIEERLFADLVRWIKDYTADVQRSAQTAASLDCLLSLADTALRNHYTRPEVNDSHTIHIQGGRHPVIEQRLPADTPYIANDTYIDDTQQQILMITGPNMSGKSAILRQTALIVLLAQMGSYVPATAATIGLVDRIFTRVGASDNLSAGESTFMVEMNETAGIMNNLSPRSLILLDEIGRGTATYDGISIAWSLAEYLHNYPVARPRTLFATHYHELNELADKYERIKNFHITTRELNNKVIFLRKLVPGGSEHSFGIHVARMAGMPRLIVERAEEILIELERKRVEEDVIGLKMRDMPAKNFQLSIFEMTDPKLKSVAELLARTEVNTLTPIEALMRLNELKRLME